MQQLWDWGRQGWAVAPGEVPASSAQHGRELPRQFLGFRQKPWHLVEAAATGPLSLSAPQKVVGLEVWRPGLPRAQPGMLRTHLQWHLE